jgi:hypothetical protein
LYKRRPLSGSKATQARTLPSSLGRHFVHPAGEIR